MERKEYFDWSTDSSQKIFPIDYSMRELGNEFSEEYRNVGNYIHRHPFFEEYILSQFQSDACEPAKKDRNAPNSLPVETLEFFRAYFALAFSDKYRKMLRWNRDIPVEAAEEFWTELCHTLAESVQAVSEPQKSDREPVENETVNRVVAESERAISEIKEFTRVLFGNAYFNRAAVSNFREEELSRRYDMLKAALKKVPAEVQINVILDCMLCLDRNIVHLGQYTDPLPEKSLKDMLVSVLKTLCQYRNVISNGHYCQYRLENIKVGREDTGTLKEAFGAIPKPSSDRNLLNETRTAYMKHLNTMHEETGLEKEYRKLRDYLSMSSVETDEEKLRQLIGQRYRQVLSALVDSLYVESNVAAPSDEFAALRYQGQIIDKMIFWYMDNFLAQFRDIISLIKHYNIAYYSNWVQCRQRKVVIGRQADSEKIDRARRVLEGMTCEVQVEYNYTYQEASCFFAQFLVMWEYLKLPPLKHKNGVFAREEIPKIVRQIRKNVRPLADYLKRPELIASPETLSRALEDYLIIAENPTTYMPYGKIISVIPPLLQGLFFVVIFRHLCDPDPFVKSFLKFKNM